MMTVLILALALLCGVSIGVIVGIAVCYVSWSRQANDSTDIDYSGGL